MANSNNQTDSPVRRKRPFIISAVKLVRPHQWIKNGFVFAALVFAKRLFDLNAFLTCLAAFGIFCMISGSVYILNDIIDRDKDRAHYKKRSRPIACGDVAVWQAVIMFIFLLCGALVSAFLLDIIFGAVVVSYFVLNVAYSLGIKRVPILDIMCVSAGFVLRVVGGGAVIRCQVSPWLLLCTMLLALFLAIQKRRGEIEAVETGNAEGRAVLQHYSRELLRDMSSVMDSTTIMAYCLYTFNSETTSLMMLTIPFVIYGIFRYQYIVSNLGMAETPEKALIKDKPLLADVFLWCVACFGVLYYPTFL